MLLPLPLLAAQRDVVDGEDELFRSEHPVSDRLLPTRLVQDGRTLRLDAAVAF